eukprot:GHVU01228975.1.p1 GENE.GHVU01228975.1~~GHVU01228975.1.p1  ORF type:complete len:572 (+),score=156.40 GHVU01228975.1:299-2014(+)
MATDALKDVGARLKEEVAELQHTDPVYERCVNDFKDELERGLRGHDPKAAAALSDGTSSIRMLDTFIEKQATGNEEALTYALDFGGTNFRVLRMKLKDGTIATKQKQFEIGMQPTGTPRVDSLMSERATASQLFNFFAESTNELIKECGDDKNGLPVPVGFTFSFPCRQTAINNSVLLKWTKGFATGRSTKDPVEGQDVAVLMQTAFKKCGVNANLVAVANDTAGVLMGVAYERRAPCEIGLIVGTGCNAAYVEPQSLKFGYAGTIINTECGNFNKLPLTERDKELDAASNNPHNQLLEKQISGAYLGERTRLGLKFVCAPLESIGGPWAKLSRGELEVSTAQVAQLAAERQEIHAGGPAGAVPKETVDILKQILKTVDTGIIRNAVTALVREEAFKTEMPDVDNIVAVVTGAAAASKGEATPDSTTSISKAAVFCVMEVAAAVLERSACMTAVILAGIVRRIAAGKAPSSPADGGQGAAVTREGSEVKALVEARDNSSQDKTVVAAVDGSLYKKNRFYRVRVSARVSSFLGKHVGGRLLIVPGEDGSGKGAGVAAITHTGAAPPPGMCDD